MERFSNRTDKYVITIGREFGSGGHEIGKLLAAKLGIAFYDSELIDEASKRSGVSTNFLERADEKAPNFFDYALYGGLGTDSLMSNDNFYVLQSNVILSLASEKSCVIVGRSADYILRNHPCCINIYIHAPLEFRMKNVIDRQDISLEDAELLINKKDRSRSKFYNFYTDKIWGHASSYDLCIDSSILGIERSSVCINNFIEMVLQKVMNR